MSKNSEKAKLKAKKPLQNKSEENTKKKNISIKAQNTKDNMEYKNLIKTNKLLSDYFSPNIGLKNMSLTFRCLFCHKIPKIRINYPNFKVFVSCDKHRISLSYQEFLEKGYNNDLVSVPCNKCGKSHNYKMRGSYNICLQCNKIFCPECSSAKIKCDAYKNTNTSNKKEKKNMYINNTDEQHSKNHVFIKLDNYDNKCHLHQSSQLSLYCLDCQCELCARCHEVHAKGHKIRTLSKYTVNSKYIEGCFEKMKNEKDNIEFVEKYIKIFSDKNKEEEKMKKNLRNYLEQDKKALEIKNRILLSYRDKKSNYNSIRNVKKLKYPWINSINPEELDKIKDKKEIYKYLNIYLIEGNLNEDQISINDNNSQEDSDSSESNISFLDLPENNNNVNTKNKNKENKINVCFINDYEIIEKENKKNKKEKKKEKINISDKSKKQLSDMKNFLIEQDEITIECLLGLKNTNFAMGLRNGDINIYKNDMNKKNYIRILKISEHKSGINSLHEIQENIILTASSDRFLKKISLSEDNTNYKVEFIFNSHTSSVYKGIKLKTKNILSCGINDYLILWKLNIKKEENKENEIYTSIQITDAGQGITDIIETKEGNFICASDILQFWNFYDENSNINLDEINKESELDEKEEKETKSGERNNKIIYDSTESQFSLKINQIINKKETINDISNIKDINNNNNVIKEKGKFFLDENNKKEYYKRKGHLELKTSSANCLCKLNTRYLFAILSEENIGKIAIIDIKKIECINIIEISKYELTSISNFNEDSIIISCTEKIEESFVVFIKQYRISRLSGLKLIGQKTKKLSEYYIKSNEKNKKLNIDKITYENAKKIREQINCITYTTGGLLICTGKIESPEINKVIGEVDLFI